MESETSNPTDNQGEKSSDSYNLTAEENNVENSCNADSMSIGFGEVIEYIERGLTLPGIKDFKYRTRQHRPETIGDTKEKEALGTRGLMCSS